MAITNFIPTVWSETLTKELDKQYVGVRNCTREFEGEIKGKGSALKICGVGPVSVFDYTKNTNMTDNYPQELTDTQTTLVISQSKAFHFQIDDVDKVQSKPSLMRAAMNNAANALAEVADRYVYSLYADIKSENSLTWGSLDEETVIDLIVGLREKFYHNNVNSNVETVLEVPPYVASIILRAKIANLTDNTEEISNGYIGKIAGFKVFVTNSLPTDRTEHVCIARTTRAIAFAEQLNEVEAYRPEKRFADAIKGLHLYGAKIVYPDEIMCIKVYDPALDV